MTAEADNRGDRAVEEQHVARSTMMREAYFVDFALAVPTERYRYTAHGHWRLPPSRGDGAGYRGVAAPTSSDWAAPVCNDRRASSTADGTGRAAALRE